MCGRTCLTLQPDEILCACKYKIPQKSPVHKQNNNNEYINSEEIKAEPISPKKEVEVKGDSPSFKKENLSQGETKPTIKDLKVKEEMLLKPEWRAEFNCGRSFTPSYNIAPTDITPVLVSSAHFCEADEEKGLEGQTRILMPMMWGMIPFWHKGDYRRHGLTTHNCRLEHMLDSKLYAGPFRRGQRCVVLCEGFFEWQTTKTAKPSERAVHFIYMPQQEGIKIYEHSNKENINLLKVAGIFDVWTDDNGDKIYSYSVITYESSKLLSWMHHRMPAILETEDQVNDWLDFKRVTGKKALDLLKPAKHLEWHRVSNVVNNSRNKSPDCTKPYEMMQTKKNLDNTPKNNSLLSWLNVRKRREESLNSPIDEDSDCVSNDFDEGPQVKRPKFRDFKKIVNSSDQAANDSSSDKTSNDNASK